MLEESPPPCQQEESPPPCHPPATHGPPRSTDGQTRGGVWWSVDRGRMTGGRAFQQEEGRSGVAEDTSDGGFVYGREDAEGETEAGLSIP